jgi:hypothetical protein
MPSLSKFIPLCAAALFLVGAASPVPEKEVRTRFTKIVGQLEKLRFCQSSGCRYRDIHWEVSKTKDAKHLYKGLIRADIIRPSGSVDKGRYVFDFVDSHWKLRSGTETTDVNDASYVGDTYDFSSAYGRTPIQGKITDKDNDLLTGYKLIYLRVLDKGIQK